MTDEIDRMLEEADRHLSRNTCAAGHPLVVATKATLWLTVDDGDVTKAVVTADEGDAGSFNTPWGVLFCTQSGCKAEIPDSAADRVIEIAKNAQWPDPVLEG